MRLSLLPVLSTMGVPTDYAEVIIRINGGLSATDKEVEHAVQFIAEEARRKLMSVS